MGEVGAVAILSVFALCCFRACRARRGCGFRGRRIRRNGTSKRGAGVCFAAESKAERLARCAEFRACFFVLCLGGAREKPPCVNHSTAFTWWSLNWRARVSIKFFACGVSSGAFCLGLCGARFPVVQGRGGPLARENPKPRRNGQGSNVAATTGVRVGV